MDSPLASFFRRMQSVAKLFRFVELCILLLFLSWLSTRLPFAVRISGEYFRRFSVLILSPASIFLVGNAIVVTLLAKSGLFSPESSSPIDNAVVSFYDELRSEISDEIISPPAVDEEIVYQDKQMICVENTKIAIDHHPKASDNEEDEVKASYRRSQSENLRRESEEMKMNNQKLRRSETDIRRKDFAGGEDDANDDDVMSNEEFQRTIEDFIARQVRFHREERLAVVLHGRA